MDAVLAVLNFYDIKRGMKCTYFDKKEKKLTPIIILDYIEEMTDRYITYMSETRLNETKHFDYYDDNDPAIIVEEFGNGVFLI
jgi:hypothetical protein